MAQSILDLYESLQTQLRVDTISRAAREASITPFSENDTFNADSTVLSDNFLNEWRKGTLNTTAYSSTVVYDPE